MTLLVGFIVLAVVYILGTSVYVIPTDKKLVSYFLGTYNGLYVSGDHSSFRRGSRVRHGLFGYDVVILLWPFYPTLYVPTSDITLQYRANLIYTKNGIPVTIMVTIVFRLGDILLNFIKTFNIFGGRQDLAKEVTINYQVDWDKEKGERKFDHYEGPCISVPIIKDTTYIVHEALRQAAKERTWDQIRGDMPNFEAEVRWRLAAPESPFAQAGILVRTTRTSHPLDAEGGVAVHHDAHGNGAFDLNVSDVVPENAEFLASLSAPATGKNTGKGEKNRLQEIASLDKLDARIVMGNETLRKANSLNVVAGGKESGLLGILNRLIGGK